MKLKVTKGDKEIVGMTLNLVQKDDCLYTCIETGIEIVDGFENEIETMKKHPESSEYFDFHLFSVSFGNKLVWIEEAVRIL